MRISAQRPLGDVTRPAASLGDGSEAVESAPRRAPDLAVLDGIELGGMRSSANVAGS